MMVAGGLELTMPARAENVAVVRHAVTGLAEAVGMEGNAISDLKTVVTEACMNVVLHAYEDGEGPLEVFAEPDPDGLTVSVRDHGSGIQPRADLERRSLRLGLSLIGALSSSFEIHGAAGRGTEVRMRLELSRNGSTPPLAPPQAREAMESGAVIAVSESKLVAPVVSRVLSMLAARTELSVDRYSDAILLGDAISAHAPAAFTDGRVRMVIEDGDGTVDMRIGPMEQGSGQRLRQRLELPEVSSTLEKLADEVAVEQADDGDYLVVRVAPN
jgi:anti-sigma regulatory factor (Ser/Thr protein kinase)